MPKRQRLYHSYTKGGWTEELSGSMAVGTILVEAGATEEDFDTLGDPEAARKVVELLKRLNVEDAAK